MIVNIQVRDYEDDRINTIIKSIEKYTSIEDWEVICDTLWIRMDIKETKTALELTAIEKVIIEIILEANKSKCFVSLSEESVYA